MTRMTKDVKHGAAPSASDKFSGSSVYKKTATRAQNGTVYAFGRYLSLEGKPTNRGGYILFKQKESYNGHLPGGIERRWVVDKEDLTYPEAVAIMNKRCGFKAFDTQ